MKEWICQRRSNESMITNLLPPSEEELRAEESEHSDNDGSDNGNDNGDNNDNGSEDNPPPEETPTPPTEQPPNEREVIEGGPVFSGGEEGEDISEEGILFGR